MFDDIESAIRDILSPIPSEACTKEWETPRWTKEIKERLCELGHKLGYKVCASNYNDKDWGEWLFDLVWLLSDKNGYLTSVPLVMECEWDYRSTNIEDDFQKLILARAHHRIMIFQQKTKDEVLRGIE